MVLVTVGEHDAADKFAILNKIGDVGDDNIHAEKFRFREHEAGVDDENVVFVAEGEAVHAEFAESAQRYDLELCVSHGKH
ncbi:hypothetical protein GCM10011586_37130 [Silvibacterium dinghuense]|nr:hypothetical protein GCM10011586_37130 [Silvibacterium dinghuense]